MSKEYEIVVVGAGIAGLSAGLTAARLGRSTLIVTGDHLGGHLLNIERIDGYPGFPEGVPGYDLCPIAQEQAADAGAEIEMTHVTALEANGERWQLKTPGDSLSAGTVILATGTRIRELDVPGESLLRGKGVSQCASCDAPLLRDRLVVVAGGGDSALQEALTLAAHCKTVTIVHHGDRLSAQAAYIGAVTGLGNVSTLPNSEITEILGDAAVDGVKIKNLGSGETSQLECAAVFGFIGLEANTDFIDNRSILDSEGCIVTDSAMRTATAGLLAAGTVRSRATGRASSAAGDGMCAAISADRYLNDGQWIAA